MTPQETAEYKQRWMPGYQVQVDVDSADWGKTLARKLTERENWSFSKHTRPDDSHTFYFQDIWVAEQFLEEYQKHNDRFQQD